MPCLQHIQFVTTSFTSQLPIKTAQGNSKCLNSAHWVAVIHRENIFCHSAKLHNDIINYKKIKCKNTKDQINLISRAPRKLQVTGFVQILDPKFKTFSRLFPKTIISFSRLKVTNRYLIQTSKTEYEKNFPIHLSFRQALTLY